MFKNENKDKFLMIQSWNENPKSSGEKKSFFFKKEKKKVFLKQLNIAASIFES